MYVPFLLKFQNFPIVIFEGSSLRTVWVRDPAWYKVWSINYVDSPCRRIKMHENINLNAVRIRDITSFTGELKCVDGKNIVQVNYDGVSPAYFQSLNVCYFGANFQQTSFFRAFVMRHHWVILLLSITFVAAYDGDAIDDTGCPMSFHGKCSCGNTTYSNWKQGEEVYVVNCTNTRFNTTEMLEMLPNGTQGDWILQGGKNKQIKFMMQARIWT